MDLYQTKYEDYLISELGEVFSDKYNSINKLKPKNKNGYLAVDISINGLIKQKYIHRLVAETFVLNQDKKSEVNHINGIKTDNRVENLEWCTREENMQHAFNVLGFKGGRLGLSGKKHFASKPIIMMKDGVVVKEFDSMSLAIKDGYRSSKISLVLSGKKKQYKGHVFILK